MSVVKDSSGGKFGDTSLISLAHAGDFLQDFEAEQADTSAFDQSVRFELVLQDNSSVVTLPGDTGTNDSAVASA